MDKEQTDCLDDILEKDLAVIFCGMAAGEEGYKTGHYYANRNNTFWKILKEVGFIKKDIEPIRKNIKSTEDILRKEKIGLTDLVKRYHGMDSRIPVTDDDIKILREKIENFRPKFFAFNGKKTAKKFFKVAGVNYGRYENKTYKELKQAIFLVLPSTAPTARRWWNKKHWHDLKKTLTQERLNGKTQ